MAIEKTNKVPNYETLDKVLKAKVAQIPRNLAFEDLQSCLIPIAIEATHAMGLNLGEGYAAWTLGHGDSKRGFPDQELYKEVFTITKLNHEHKVARIEFKNGESRIIPYADIFRTGLLINLKTYYIQMEDTDLPEETRTDRTLH